MNLTSIYVYPVKATAAIQKDIAEVRPRGLVGDRRWVISDEQGQFLHQRIHPKLALLKTDWQGDGLLTLTAPSGHELRVVVPDGERRCDVTVWGDTVDAADAGEKAADWLSQFLGLRARLLYMDDAATRPVATPRGRPGDEVSFADGMPLLLTTTASLQDLNQRLERPVPMSRFRPNVVVDGALPWEEEQWQRVTIGDVDFEMTHACVRCLVTTIDQQTAEKSPQSEPLRTLATFRNTDDGVCFGINLIPRSRGEIRVGDPVSVPEDG